MLEDISIADIRAVDETIKYIEQHGDNISYEDLVKHLSWYWRQPIIAGKDSSNNKPSGWLLDWIKTLV
jgi:hypothetical protein